MKLDKCMICQGEIKGRGLFRFCKICVKDWKWCNACQKAKSRDAFKLPGGRSIGYCYPCYKEKSRERLEQKDVKDYHYQYHLKRKFQIEQEEAEYWTTHRTCEICGLTGDRSSMKVDHDHKTGKIRGVLCNYHNFMVSVLESDPIWLKKIQQWIR